MPSLSAAPAPEAPAVLLVLLDPARAVEGEAALRTLRNAHPGAKLVLLGTARTAALLHPLADEVWNEGEVRGFSRFLALVRRIAWMRAAHVYDLDGGTMARFMRLCVWPRPQWHDRMAVAALRRGERALS
jgi:hypothetical protein